MDEKQMLTQLFKNRQIELPAGKMNLLNQFLKEEDNIAAIHLIAEKENQLMQKWKIQERIAEIMQQPVRILNATVGKPYEALIDLKKLKLQDITLHEFAGLEEVGLSYNENTKLITGVPEKSGDLPLLFRFKIADQPDDAAFTEKPITLVVNPNPRSLWKELETDKNDLYWKEDNVTLFTPLGDRQLLASSKRGRSHANVGSCREDDFAYKSLANGWSVLVVADGAGSSKFSRKGSALACQSIVDHFVDPSSVEAMIEFDDLIRQHKENTGEEIQRKLNRFVYNNLGKAAFQVHKKLEAFAQETSITLKDLSSTLIFTLFKKYEIGYAFLSFGVGDCPIAIINKNITEVTLMNRMDVGEFGGGTRFITMPEIFQNEKFASRFGFKLVDDFSYLFMMTDGIYDPKFVVEANLPNIKKWQEFLADLSGGNEENLVVELSTENKNIETQFSAWMDFWSKGNHDDRTLAILF